MMHANHGRVRRLAQLLYALACYAVFLATLVYLVGFVSGLWRWLRPSGSAFHALDEARASSVGGAIGVDLSLVALFALQHSVMARSGFKRRWVRVVGPTAERSTYVLASSACLALLCLGWRPIGGPWLWSTSGTALEPVLAGFSVVGWAIALLATFLLDHLELFGLRQAWLAFRGRAGEPPRFATPGLYRSVRHPLYLGFLLAFWAAPAMSLAHLVFAAAFTAYVLAGIRLEERDLIAAYGDRYREYRRRTPMLLPLRWRRKRGPVRAAAPSPAPASPAAPSGARTAS